MSPLYQRDLAYIHAAAFGTLARGAAPEILRRLRDASVAVRHVLDVGCGAGPLAAVLCEAGFDVTGIDPSAELLAFAREAAPAARFFHASAYDTELPACDAIVAVGEPLTYQPAKLEEFIGQASTALKPGGLLIFDLIECGEPSLAARTWLSGEDWAVGVETAEDPAARTLTRSIDTFVRDRDVYRRGREVHRVRLFDPPQVIAVLAASGFTVETAPNYGGQALSLRRRAFFATLTGSNQGTQTEPFGHHGKIGRPLAG